MSRSQNMTLRNGLVKKRNHRTDIDCESGCTKEWSLLLLLPWPQNTQPPGPIGRRSDAFGQKS